MPDADTAAPAATIPLVLPAAHFTDRAKFLRPVPLTYPVTFAGRDWTAIHLRRLSVAQIAAVFAHYNANRESDPNAPMEWPVFVDESGVDIPAGLLDELDPDDADAVAGAVTDFLPRRYAAKTDPAPSTPETGASTSDSPSE